MIRPSLVLSLAALTLFAAPASAEDAPPAAEGRLVPKEVAVDTNKDGKPDRWERFEGGKRSKIESDTDGDGNIDEWMTMDGDKPLKVERDSDRDGKVDQWITY